MALVDLKSDLSLIRPKNPDPKKEGMDVNKFPPPAEKQGTEVSYDRKGVVDPNTQIPQRSGVPLSEIGKAKEAEVKVEEVEATVVDPTLEDLKEQAKGLGIRGYNNAKKDTLIKKIAEAGAEDGEEEGS